MLGHEGLDVVPVAQSETGLPKEVEAAAAGEEAGADAVVEQCLAFEWPATDALVTGEDDEADPADDRQPGGVGSAGRYEAVERSGPGDVAGVLLADDRGVGGAGRS